MPGRRHSRSVTWLPRFLRLGFFVSKAVTASMAAPSVFLLRQTRKKEDEESDEDQDWNMKLTRATQLRSTWRSSWRSSTRLGPPRLSLRGGTGGRGRESFLRSLPPALFAHLETWTLFSKAPSFLAVCSCAWVLLASPAPTSSCVSSRGIWFIYRVFHVEVVVGHYFNVPLVSGSHFVAASPEEYKKLDCCGRRLQVFLRIHSGSRVSLRSLYCFSVFALGKRTLLLGLVSGRHMFGVCVACGIQAYWMFWEMTSSGHQQSLVQCLCRLKSTGPVGLTGR